MDDNSMLDFEIINVLVVQLYFYLNWMNLMMMKSIVVLFVDDVFREHIHVRIPVNGYAVNQQETSQQLHWNINMHDNEAKI